MRVVPFLWTKPTSICAKNETPQHLFRAFQSFSELFVAHEAMQSGHNQQEGTADLTCEWGLISVGGHRLWAALCRQAAWLWGRCFHQHGPGALQADWGPTGEAG